MKILIGVCGIGFGHSTRQYEIAKSLINCGHDVRIVTYGTGIQYFGQTNISYYNIWVPLIKFKGEKLDIKSIVQLNIFNFIPGLIRNRRIVAKLKMEGFIPDICISDYEPVSARIAYKFGKPLVIIDQQSKFWRFSFDKIGQFSNVEERKRLDLFFPKYNYRFITSFYKLPEIDSSDTKIIPPIIRSDLKHGNVLKNSKKQIVVYFSKYLNKGIGQNREDICKIFSKIEDVNFIIFSNDMDNEQINYSNIKVEVFNRDKFSEKLMNSDGIISTAGHTLLSEAFYLGLSAYVIPLDTFDQNYCAKFIVDNQLGCSSDSINFNDVKKFIDNLDLYQDNIKHCSELLLQPDPVNEIVDFLEKLGKGAA